jgi:hypothetical protein
MLTHGRNVSYDIPDPHLPQASQWLISNPNRINLGRIGLQYKGDFLTASHISEPHQELDLWSGVISSTFKIDGQLVKVVTQGDFESDSAVFEIHSNLVSSGDLTVGLDFPYPPIHSTKYKYEVFVGSYDFPQNHTTSIVGNTRDGAHIFHQLQETTYFVNLRWPASSLQLSRASNATHRYTLAPSSSSTLKFTANFAPDKRVPDSPKAIQHQNPTDWKKYWTRGGFVDLTASSNSKADELQRRIILSLYHVRVNSAAKGQSPQESGLMNNGWYGMLLVIIFQYATVHLRLSAGKFHMEMVVWHNAHWATWGRQEHFDNIFPALYESLLPSSLARAKSMGWEGARSVLLCNIS